MGKKLTNEQQKTWDHLTRTDWCTYTGGYFLGTRWPAEPFQGDMFFNTESQKSYIWTGHEWNQIAFDLNEETK